MEFKFEEVPPPETVPVQDRAQRLGLLDGLRAEDREGGWRCSSCNKYQTGDKTLMVWVPDNVKRTDSTEEIKDMCRRSAYNGTSSGWCVSCAKKLGKSFFQRMFG